MKLTIIIPVYNEEKTISEVINKIKLVKIKGVAIETIIVDDGSHDKSARNVKRAIAGSTSIKFITHKKNMGKGAAVRSGIQEASGDYIIIQDADLEYDPKQIPVLFKEIENGSQVIYGTRLNRLPNLHKEERRVQFLAHYFGNRFLSLLTSILYGQWVTDMETCYKLFPAKAAKSMALRSRRFDFEPEITSKLLKSGYKIREVPIIAVPRGYEAGKKLNTFRDGFIALWTLLKYRVVN